MIKENILIGEPDKDGVQLRVGDIGMYRGERYKITLSKSRGIELYLLDKEQGKKTIAYGNISFYDFKKETRWIMK